MQLDLKLKGWKNMASDIKEFNNINVDTNKLISDKFLFGLTYLLHEWHTKNRLPCKGKNTEEKMQIAFKYAGFQNVGGDPNENTTGKDLYLLYEDDILHVSCKSGQLNWPKKKTSDEPSLPSITALKISCCRTTKHVSLEEKINYISKPHEDIIISLSSTLYSERGFEKYILAVIKPLQFDKNLRWKEYGKRGSFKLMDKPIGISGVTIEKNASEQVWVTLDNPYANNPYVLDAIEIPVEMPLKSSNPNIPPMDDRYPFILDRSRKIA